MHIEIRSFPFLPFCHANVSSSGFKWTVLRLLGVATVQLETSRHFIDYSMKFQAVGLSMFTGADTGIPPVNESQKERVVSGGEREGGESVVH